MGMREVAETDAAPSGAPRAQLGRRPVVWTVLTGSAVGAAYGMALRAWMRFISTDPEFTWSGTAYIVGAFTVLGTMAGLATAARHRRRRRSLLVVRGVGIVLSLACFVAAGAAMLPTIVPAALGRARTDWNHVLRIALVATGAATAVILSLFVTMTELPLGRLALGTALYLALCCVEVELTARLYAPSLPTGTLRRPARVGATIGVFVLLVGLVGLMVGIRGTS
jgi:hypothetical protein